ncbi:MAG: SIMPL domain-containing protein [Gracilimonas sp.]|nr:SIMPL domain-containing protein [Gracilimonas sp.]
MLIRDQFLHFSFNLELNADPMMNRIIFFLLPVLMISCTQDDNRSIKLGVDQTVEIPVEYVSVIASLQLEGSEAASVEKKGYETLADAVALLNNLGYEGDDLEINSGEVSNRSYRDRESYHYNSSIQFDIYDLDKIDTFRRALTEKGVNTFRITKYKNMKEDSLYDVAYRQAIQRAREKAQQLIMNESVEIGEILNLSENVRETITFNEYELEEVIQTKQVAEMPAPPVDPLFNKPTYNRQIEFTIEFALQ